jgi:hypothetical protein
MSDDSEEDWAVVEDGVCARAADAEKATSAATPRERNEIVIDEHLKRSSSAIVARLSCT